MKSSKGYPNAKITNWNFFKAKYRGKYHGNFLRQNIAAMEMIIDSINGYANKMMGVAIIMHLTCDQNFGVARMIEKLNIPDIIPVEQYKKGFIYGNTYVVMCDHQLILICLISDNVQVKS